MYLQIVRNDDTTVATCQICNEAGRFDKLLMPILHLQFRPQYIFLRYHVPVFFEAHVVIHYMPRIHESNERLAQKIRCNRVFDVHLCERAFNTRRANNHRSSVARKTNRIGYCRIGVPYCYKFKIGKFSFVLICWITHPISHSTQAEISRFVKEKVHRNAICSFYNPIS